MPIALDVTFDLGVLYKIFQHTFKSCMETQLVQEGFWFVSCCFGKISKMLAEDWWIKQPEVGR